MSTLQYWFTLFAFLQGAAVLGLTIFIFVYYLPRKAMNLPAGTRIHILIATLSYLMLTLATMQTAVYGFYDWGNVWYWIVLVAYVSGDVSLIYIFRNAVKKQFIEKMNNELDADRIIKMIKQKEAHIAEMIELLKRKENQIPDSTDE